jgi:hypothetical protein
VAIPIEKLTYSVASSAEHFVAQRLGPPFRVLERELGLISVTAEVHDVGPDLVEALKQVSKLTRHSWDEADRLAVLSSSESNLDLAYLLVESKPRLILGLEARNKTVISAGALRRDTASSWACSPTVCLCRSEICRAWLAAARCAADPDVLVGAHALASRLGAVPA